ncbi:MAG: serine protease [Actinomycetia bacterium]|nr:serine protease [Actinomycetes bacterium]
MFGMTERLAVHRRSSGMKPLRPALFAIATFGLLLGIVPVTGTAGAVQAWAPAATATIHPGVMTFTAGAQCTANFIFQDGGGTYIGQAAHCSGTGAATDTNGCTAASLPLGTAVEVDGAAHPGTLVYNSWLTMQGNGEADPDTCQYNDLALVKLDPADVANVNPSVPRWGGPVAVGGGTAMGDQVYSYGNSSLRFGISQLSPKTGVSLGDASGGWTHTVYTVSPGIPGDSGSGFLDASGKAIGVLSTVAIAPLPASNGVGDLAHELAYLHAHSSFTGVQLVPGDVAFRPGLPL